MTTARALADLIITLDRIETNADDEETERTIDAMRTRIRRMNENKEEKEDTRCR